MSLLTHAEAVEIALAAQRKLTEVTAERNAAEFGTRTGDGKMSLDVTLRTELYSANITHNLGKMAKEAGIYEHLWRPDELGIWNAGELILPLADGLAKLKADPEH